MSEEAMFTSLEKIGLVCISIVGFQISRFLFRVIYNNVLGPTLGLNRVNLKEMGKWAGKQTRLCGVMVFGVARNNEYYLCKQCGSKYRIMQIKH